MKTILALDSPFEPTIRLRLQKIDPKLVQERLRGVNCLELFIPTPSHTEKLRQTASMLGFGSEQVHSFGTKVLPAPRRSRKCDYRILHPLDSGEFEIVEIRI